MKKCALHNLGCKVNSYETQAMRKLMEEAGYEIVPFGEEAADVFIINTCSVTNMADRKSRQMIHRARALNPDAVIVASGCYTESAGELLDKDIDLVIGNNEKSRLAKLLEAYFAGGPRGEREDISRVCGFDAMRIDKPLEHTRAYVKIQDGCNRFCSYCIIPYVRGRIRSRAKEDVLCELRRLAEGGCLEAVLTGIHLSSYGLDFKSDKNVTLIDIIEETDRIEGIERLRLGSLEPLIVTEDFVQRLSKCRKVCPHFHLSLQSGSDGVLSRMNRRYTADEFAAGVGLLRKYFDSPAITTDVIVGFPGETE
ncbi:MAG: MiaB/RimO family radical SAM methylthiotransferase, partial [Butyrivibrio sp.]|nr:MiaB/RimO family radical SAM methylthiotransferase [Butyrivibrio sp.]